MKPEIRDKLLASVRSIPDFPKKGVLFRDITPLLLKPELYKDIIAEMAELAQQAGCDKIAAIDARGFLFGATLAHVLHVGFLPVRKKGKLPCKTLSQAYQLEYGTAEIEIHVDALQAGERAVLVDDLLATGGTASAAISLIERAGAKVTLALFLIELVELGGRSFLAPHKVESLLSF
ncbi:MAG: adenine phosphoribosyltransferase [Chthoniobacterales bacterium]|nr:adenine phosphoribosyltransferase [Chthoniobacterales bacterium]